MLACHFIVATAVVAGLGVVLARSAIAVPDSVVLSSVDAGPVNRPVIASRRGLLVYDVVLDCDSRPDAARNQRILIRNYQKA